MPRVVRVTPFTQMEQYHNPKMLLRPINRGLVEQYAQALRDGAEFPPIVVGNCPTEDGGRTQFMVDGNHIYRACALAEKAHKVEFLDYPNVASALADQLRRNMRHGLHLSTGQRNQRIKDLVEKYNWSTRQIGEAIGLSNASVSRIYREIQDTGGTGRPGRQAGAAPQGPKPLAPRQFITAVENLHRTLSDPGTRAQTLAAIYSPGRPQEEIQRIVGNLQSLIDELSMLVQPTPTRPARAMRGEVAAQAA